MNSELIGINLSFFIIFLIIAMATVLQKLLRLSPEFSRKIIHIAVGNWVILAYFYFSTWWIACIVPACFIIINYVSYRYAIFRAMELDDKNPGTVYYSISLTFLTVFTFYKEPALTFPYLGMMAMTWGDGFAAIVGSKFPIRPLRKGKSLGGALAFIIFSLLAAIGYLLMVAPAMQLGIILLISLLTAIVGAFVELFSPKNTDNLTVPLIVGILAGILEIGKVL